MGAQLMSYNDVIKGILFSLLCSAFYTYSNSPLWIRRCIPPRRGYSPTQAKQGEEMNPKEGDTSSDPLVPPPPPPPLPPVPSAERVNKEEGKLEQEEAKQSKRDDGAAAAAADDDDDGYLTPTSPRHKIPVPLECPAAPRKPHPRLFLKRKMRSTCQVDRERETGFDHLSRELDEFAPVAKKTKAEAADAK
ncbi:hypothetical protein BHE74_00004447 [Ensete ventricosum]|nr:hypothetical protein BHE74_00004447 [Ensete ventricosum]